jgi:Na+-transporting methylmalonyl-CoA/oxaloacetate decarboxylase gamma subunit
MEYSTAIGLQLTLYGMGLVFTMLTLLWAGMKLLLRVDRPKTEAERPEAQPRPKPDALDPDLLAAITVAVLDHQAVRQKQAAPAMRSHRPGELPSRWVGTGRTRQNRAWESQKD